MSACREARRRYLLKSLHEDLSGTKYERKPQEAGRPLDDDRDTQNLLTRFKCENKDRGYDGRTTGGEDRKDFWQLGYVRFPNELILIYDQGNHFHSSAFPY